MPDAERHSVVVAVGQDEAVVPVPPRQPCGCETAQQESCFGSRS